jgi:hypothetical protein
VVLVEIADADVTDTEPVSVVEVPPDDLSGRLADAVLVAWPGEFSPVEAELVVGPVDVGGALVGLERADGVVRGGVDDTLDPCLRGGLVDRVRSVDVVRDDTPLGGRPPWVTGQVNHRVDTLDGRSDGLDVLYLAGVVRHTGVSGRLTVVHEPPVVGLAQPLEDRPTDVPARSCEQYPHSSPTSGSSDK